MLQRSKENQMTFKSNVQQYLGEYHREHQTALRGGQHTAELSFRVPMHNLFQRIAEDLSPSRTCDIILEPRHQGCMGRPDWRIQDHSSLGVYGYIEAKGFSDKPLDIRPHLDQIQRYLALGHKLIITDGIDFVFCFDTNAQPITISLIDKERINQDWSTLPINPSFQFHMNQFFSTPAPQHINEERLIELVAVRTRNLADEILSFSGLTEEEALNQDERNIIELLNDVRNLLYNHNDPNMRTDRVFADFIAQIIMFSLLYAHRILCSSNNSPQEKESAIRSFVFNDITEEDIKLLPFRRLMVYLRDPANNTFIGHWVDECISFLSFVQMTDEQLQNPDFHHLFELFFNKFDRQTRFDYGVFYTPEILANFVVKLVNKIVADNFDGATIYDNNNTIIDPCCGTGSFLEQIIAQDPDDGTYNLCGFEILPAPYMLANYRMTLIEQRYARQNLNSNIILANTLSNCLLNADANNHSIEGQELIRAKNLSLHPLQLIIGNPPSSDSIRNDTAEDFSNIIELMNDFRPPVENRHGRQNIQKQINNPFMRFIRWSCQKLLTHDDTHSVLAFIVPLSFLETESYKYARKYLIEHFSGIWAIAIDADTRTGIRNDSLFNTLQGRAIIVLARRAGENRFATDINFIDYSRASFGEKTEFLRSDIESIMTRFTTFAVNNAMYSFVPARHFNEELYSAFWPINTETNTPGIFIKQCSGAKLSPTALLTHVNQPILRRRSREIAADGVTKAREWVGNQDKPVNDSKVIAFQNALRSCPSGTLETNLNNNIRPCSFRPFVNSNVLLWSVIFDYQTGVGGGGSRVRPEIRNAYNSPDTIGFSLAHAPKDLDENLGRFASFCWYFPDNDLCRRGNAHIYLNQYVQNTRSVTLVNNINDILIESLTELTELSSQEVANKIVFYSYAVFCSQVYLDEFYGALFVVNQTENRARIPIVNSREIFMHLSELGERLALLERNNTDVENLLNLDYAALLSQLPRGFHLEHSRSATRNPYDEEHEEIILRDENNNPSIQIYCPLAIQKFTVSGYNVIKDCWLKFHSYRYTHCDFTSNDFRELLDLLNKIASQMQIVSDIDDIMHRIVREDIPLLNYHT